MKGSKRKLLLKCLYVLQLLHLRLIPNLVSRSTSQRLQKRRKKTEDVEDGFGHVIKKGMKYPEEVLLERKCDSDNLYTIPKKPKSAFFVRESEMFPSVQLESKKGHFELNNKELLMIMKYMELSNQTLVS